jgi:hypothetical protein
MALNYKKKVQSANATTTNLLSANVRLVRQLGEVHEQLAKTDATVDQLTTDLVAQERRLGELAIAAAQLEKLTLQLAALEAADQDPAGKGSSSSFRDECQRLEAALSGLTNDTRGLCTAVVPLDLNGEFEHPEAAGGGIKLDFSTAQQQDHASLSTLSVPTSGSLSIGTISDNTNSTDNNSITKEIHHNYHNFHDLPPAVQVPVIHSSISKLHAVETTSSGLGCRDNNKNLTQQNWALRRITSLPLKRNHSDCTTNEIYASEDFSSSSLTTVSSLSTYSDYKGRADEEEEDDGLDMFLRKAAIPSSAMVSTTTAIATSNSMSTDDCFKSSKNSRQLKETGDYSTGSSGATSTTQIIEGLLLRHKSKRSSEVGLTSTSQVSAEFSSPITSGSSENGISGSAGPGHRRVTSKASQLLNQTIAEDHCSEASKIQQDGPSLNKKLSSFFTKFV